MNAVPIALTKTQIKQRTADELQRRWDYIKWLKSSDDELSSDDRFDLDASICRDDVVHFVNHWCWTFDPRGRKKGESQDLPFKLYAQQEEYLKFLQSCLEDSESGTVEKSRDQGFSWMSAAFAVWLWLFHPNSKIQFSSQKFEQVDNLNDMDSLLEKMRYIIDHLPNWYKPFGYKREKHAVLGKIYNPSNECLIKGSGGREKNRGGRATISFEDEFAFNDAGDLAVASILGTTDVAIFGSTPNGPDTKFLELVESDGYRHHQMHWRFDPRKDDVWAAKKKKQLGPVKFAQEYELNHTVSSRDAVIPMEYIQAAIGFVIPGLDSIQKIVAGLDIATTGDDKSALAIRKGPVFFPIEEAPGELKDTTKVGRWAAQRCNAMAVHELNYDASGAHVGGELNRLKESKNPDDAISFEYFGVFAQAKASKKVYKVDEVLGDGSGNVEEVEYHGYDLYADLMSELWDHAGRKFLATYLFVTEGIESDPNDMISIPNDGKLIKQLSSRRFDPYAIGKKRLMRKKKTSKEARIKSPDRADAVILSFADELRIKVHKQIFIGRA